jgi:hypothetical protein
MCPGSPVLLLEDEAPEGVLLTEPRPRDPWDDAEGPRLRCARCGHVITASGWAMQVGGSHEHSFVNPHGFLYRIGCFACAPGSVPCGDEHSAYSWFPGYAWQIAHCGACEAHLGWGFRGAADRFYGLILDRLVQQAGGEPGSG